MATTTTLKNKSDVLELSKICDKVRKSDKRIRHVGYYDGLGRILYDSIGYTESIEDNEETHILNGTVASTLNLWKPADNVIGEAKAFVFITEKIVGLIVPVKNGNHLLAIFEAKTPLAFVEETRAMIELELS